MLPGLSQASTFCPWAGDRLLSVLCKSSGLPAPLPGKFRDLSRFQVWSEVEGAATDPL